jgi:hypothetical protein
VGRRTLSQLRPETRPAFGGTCFGPERSRQPAAGDKAVSGCRMRHEFSGFFFFIYIIFFILSFFLVFTLHQIKNKTYIILERRILTYFTIKFGVGWILRDVASLAAFLFQHEFFWLGERVRLPKYAIF